MACTATLDHESRDRFHWLNGVCNRLSAWTVFERWNTRTHAAIQSVNRFVGAMW